MAVNVNQVGFHRRLAVVRQLLHDRGLESPKISTLAYSEEYKYPYNNYLFKVELATPASSSLFPGTQPGTTKAPSDGVSALVVKLSNLAVDMNNANRVENDVAVQHLVRQSMMEAGLGPLVPAVYAWAPATTTNVSDEMGFGWIMSELRDGVDLDSEFSSLQRGDKEHVLEQIAAILGAIQAAKLPETVTKFGGLTFDSSGQIVSGESPMLKEKPATSYAEWRVAHLRGPLKGAAESPLIQGWRNNGLDTRIEKFLSHGGPDKVLADVDLRQKSIIHGDFSTNNMLFDSNTKKITALLDFDWSFVSHPFDQFTFCLIDIGCNISDGDNEIVAALLSGNFTKPPSNLDKESTDKWELAKAWNTAMKKNGVVSPSDMKGVDQIRDMLRLRALLSPFKLRNKSMLEQMSDEKKAELRATSEAELVHWLQRHGF